VRFSPLPRLVKDHAALDPAARARFEAVVRERFAPDLARGRFRPGLRVKRVQGTAQVWEMTWAPDGRATWQLAEDSTRGDPHVLWRRIGTHDVLREP
jgi:hypothetical protein